LVKKAEKEQTSLPTVGIRSPQNSKSLKPP